MPKSKGKGDTAKLHERSHASFYFEVVSIFISGIFSAVLGANMIKGTLTFELLIVMVVVLIIIPLAVAKGLMKILRI